MLGLFVFTALLLFQTGSAMPRADYSVLSLESAVQAVSLSHRELRVFHYLHS